MSVTSARSVLSAIDRAKYQTFPIRISRLGQWNILPELDRLASLDELRSHPGIPVTLNPSGEGGHLTPPGATRRQDEIDLDVVFPLLHGVFGEDGTVQGLLTLADVAFVGAETMASALGMDKIFSKYAFQQAGLEAVPFWWFYRQVWRENPEAICSEIERRFDYPCFIKPSNTGSSVGVAKAHHRGELRQAIEEAASLDLKILIEKAIHAREIECGVLGNEVPEASVAGEVTYTHEFYDYEAKYQDNATEVIVPADLPEPVSEQVRSWAVRAFQAIDACGMARVDFFLERGTNRLYLNEINTIPGFTPRSMFPMLWAASGVTYPALIDRLIVLALQRRQQRQTTQGYGKSNV